MRSLGLAIGKVNLKHKSVLAPMAGVTDSPFRRVVREEGCGLLCSEMVSANGLIYGDNKTKRYLAFKPSESPLSVQIFGSEAKILSEAAKIVEDSGAEIIDLNMGCPVKKIVKNGSGSALMKQPAKVANIITELRKTVSVPLTVKIRAGWSESEENAVVIAKIADDCGVDAITVHPRYRTQGFSGKANWSIIADVKKNVSCPVIGNGDINSPLKAKEMIDQTGCDGVMVGRGAMGNPWLLKQIDRYLETGVLMEKPSLEERFNVIFKHLDYAHEEYGSHCVAVMRSHLSCYLKGLYGASAFRGVLFQIRELSELKDGLLSFRDKLISAEA